MIGINQIKMSTLPIYQQLFVKVYFLGSKLKKFMRLSHLGTDFSSTNPEAEV